MVFGDCYGVFVLVRLNVTRDMIFVGGGSWIEGVFRCRGKWGVFGVGRLL